MARTPTYIIHADGILEIDAATSITPTLNSEATKHPVEEGADVTDHVRNLPATLTLDGVLVDFPLSGTGFEGRSLEARATLEGIRLRRQPVDVVSGSATYLGFVLTGLSFPKTSSTGKAVQFSASFDEVKTVRSQFVDLPPLPPKHAKSKVDGGKKPTKEAKPETKKKARKTLGKWLGDSVADLVGNN